MSVQNLTPTNLENSQPRDELNTQSPTMKSLLDLTAPDMERINELIWTKAHSPVEMIPKLAAHLIESGGKRIRPMLTCATSRLCGYEGLDHIPLATSIEFLHTATLLHDDVVDESDTRRGKKAARLLWGNQASVLVGDYLLGQSFKIMVSVGSIDALKILSHASAVIAEGEVMQLAATGNPEATEADYMAIIDAKTAALFVAAAELGAVVSNRPENERHALMDYGHALGIVFQLVDDALDYAGETDDMGKNLGDDFREGKITLPVILAFQAGSETERQFWHRTLGKGDIEPDDLTEARALIKKYQTIETTIERARHFGRKAQNALSIFPNNKWKSALLEVVDFCIERSN